MSLYNQLFTWQKQLIDKYKDKKNLGLFIDMGLGKTIISLSFAEMHQCSKILVITINAKASEPATLSGSWLDWASKMSMQYTFKNKYSKDFSKDENELMIINYESLFERGKHVKEHCTVKQCVKDFISTCVGKNVAIIIDESHKMKDLHSLQTLAIMQIRDAVKRVAANSYMYLATGTPFTTGYVDLYSQLKALYCPMNKTEFVDRFCERGHLPGLLGWQQPIVGYKHLPELYSLVREYAVLLKLGKDANENSDLGDIELPNSWTEDIVIPESNEMKIFVRPKLKPSMIVEACKKYNVIPEKDYASMKDVYVNNPFFRNMAYPDLKWLAETSGTFWMRSRQLSIGFQGNNNECIWYDRSRLNRLERFLSNNEENYVLFYSYTPELVELYDICTKLGYNVDVYCGEIKSEVYYEKFCQLSESQQLTTKKNIILANYASGGTGKNWQKYHHCILFDLPLYSQYEQAIKRVNRLGQKSTVVYHRFYQDNFLDKGMLDALEKGVEYSEALFSSSVDKISKLEAD